MPIVRGESSRSVASTSEATPSFRQYSGNSSVRESEISHFSRLSSQWWDEQGEFGLLHSMNPVRIQFMREKMQEVKQWKDAELAVREGRRGEDRPLPPRFLEGLDVLDVGCGGGILSESLARLGARTTGLDASSSNIAIAKVHAAKDPAFSSGQHTLQYQHGTAEGVRADGKTFDVVTAMEVVEHVNAPADFLRCLGDLVKPGGHIFMSTISRNVFAYFLTIFMAEKVMRTVSPGTHTYAQYIKPEELVGFFREDVGWHSPSSLSATQKDLQSTLPERLRYETRGVAYLPWKSAWELGPRGSELAQQCNYFFWIRKPL
ncbi:ubiquinone biosynthesis O-methyltransferase [Tilletiaria anomala UBC 951]|uniref:Ubiquinone biosynthesis O-methyltransferase, mitochondrial n=1 Tax=Tilletiaria anomala (strain ATCC 24038 / CBS 436.72 / UBC 951) TaxID=1037660 RepID=A0A066WND4_TILAU|nr:ubiquinone biosynthesis O-methyltransferase [Tilletiaria anomala UBC 951]KDN52140.1 ubiquinone biosynthesis O-methyltransferase [Tilletiaria anomala UBC 951]